MLLKENAFNNSLIKIYKNVRVKVIMFFKDNSMQVQQNMDVHFQNKHVL